jgi:hypothetical protein
MSSPEPDIESSPINLTPDNSTQDLMTSLSYSERPGDEERLGELKHNDTKGRCLFAASTIRRGDCILEEPPIMKVNAGPLHLYIDPTFFGAGEGSGFPLVLEEYNKLSFEDQVKFMELNHEEKTQEWLDSHKCQRTKINMLQWLNLSRVARNAFDATPDEAMESGQGIKTFVVFEHIFCFNHSCKPNAVFKWYPQRQCGMVHALRTIRRGEEIYLSYISSLEDTLKNRKDRREILQDRWGFRCNCSLCHLPQYASDPEDDLRDTAWKEWKYLKSLQWPSNLSHNDDDYFDSLPWPADHHDVTMDDAGDATIYLRCKPPKGQNDLTILHREHRRISAYYESVSNQFKALKIHNSEL